MDPADALRPGIAVKLPVGQVDGHLPVTRVDIDPASCLAPGVAGEIAGSIHVDAPVGLVGVRVGPAAAADAELDPADAFRPGGSRSGSCWRRPARRWRRRWHRPPGGWSCEHRWHCEFGGYRGETCRCQRLNACLAEWRCSECQARHGIGSSALGCTSSRNEAGCRGAFISRL